MSEEQYRMKRRTTKVVLACMSISVSVLACSGSSSSSSGASDKCSDFSGTYDVTTEIVSTTCPLGLHTITQPVTWTFVQSAPSCSFTMTNSLYAGSVYSGTFSMKGTSASVSWTSVDPAPTAAGRALTYTAENLTIAPPVPPATTGTISGSFDWSSAYPCTGTTDVCPGSVPAGCSLN